jgi:hypothetical protein
MWLTLKTIWLTIYGNEIGNHMVDVDDAIVKLCVEPKARVPTHGTLALVFTHCCTIASSTSTF